jgi:hypothetical protein
MACGQANNKGNKIEKMCSSPPALSAKDLFFYSFPGNLDLSLTPKIG